jgi:hypothetical protein
MLRAGSLCNWWITITAFFSVFTMQVSYHLYQELKQFSSGSDRDAGPVLRICLSVK